MFLITIFIQTPLLTHSTNTAQAADVHACLCSSGNDFFSTKDIPVLRGKEQNKCRSPHCEANTPFWMHEVVLRARAVEAEK